MGNKQRVPDKLVIQSGLRENVSLAIMDMWRIRTEVSKSISMSIKKERATKEQVHTEENTKDHSSSAKCRGSKNSSIT